MNIFEEIVRELADTDPYESGNGRCQECWATIHQDHSPTCLWLRAKQAVENQPDPIEWVEIRRFDDAGNEEVLRIRKGQRTLDEVQKP